MTTLTRDPAPANGTKPSPVAIEPTRRRHRSVPMALAAAGCMVVSVVAFVGLQMAAGDRKPVLAVARPIEAGAVITDADLTVAQLATDPALSPVPLSARASVVGRTAAVDLRPGTLLTDASIGASAAVDAGEALVGVEVPAAAAPVGAVRSGDRVRLIEVAKPGDGRPAAPGNVLAEGRVLRVGATSSSSTTTQLAVVVPTDAAPAVTSASVGQRIAVVVVP